jgi:hypothetical protein
MKLGRSCVGAWKLLDAQATGHAGKIWDEAHLQIWQKQSRKLGLICHRWELNSGSPWAVKGTNQLS